MSVSADSLGGVNSHYDAFGVSGKYTDRDAVETDATVIVTHDLSPYGSTVEVSGAYILVSARKSEVPYPPRTGEYWDIDGKTYVVDSLLAEDELEHTVLAT